MRESGAYCFCLLTVKCGDVYRSCFELKGREAWDLFRAWSGLVMHESTI